jgi:hypothetical protein
MLMIAERAIGRQTKIGDFGLEPLGGLVPAG